MELRAKWLQNPLVAKNMGWQIRKGTDLQDQLEWFGKKYAKNENNERFIIEADGKAIGIVGLTDGSPLDKNACLYILIGEDDFRGIGIGREACNYILDYGFNKLKLHRIYLYVNGYNEAGIHLYKSLGFVEEGVQKDHILYEGKYYPEIFMGMVRNS